MNVQGTQQQALLKNEPLGCSDTDTISENRDNLRQIQILSSDIAWNTVSAVYSQHLFCFREKKETYTNNCSFPSWNNGVTHDSSFTVVKFWQWSQQLLSHQPQHLQLVNYRHPNPCNTFCFRGPNSIISDFIQDCTITSLFIREQNIVTYPRFIMVNLTISTYIFCFLFWPKNKEKNELKIFFFFCKTAKARKLTFKLG